MTSGSPFRRLIDEGILDPTRLVEFGIQTHSNSTDLWKVASQYGVKTIPFTQLRNGKAVPAFKAALKALRGRCDEVLISVDLDALSYAFAPGVSAPQAEGFTASELFQMLEIAGSDKKVTSVGFFELSPPLDFQNYTSRLTAQAAWHFLDAALF
jgi:formiminoglutamase